MKIAFVILNYRSFGDSLALARQLLAVPAADLRVVLVDNASPNREDLACWTPLRQDPRVRIIEHPVNDGYARGNNLGLDLCLAEGYPHVVVLNPDVVLPDPVAFVHALERQITLGGYLCVGFGVAGIRPYFAPTNLLTLLFPVITRQIVDRLLERWRRPAEGGRLRVGRVYGCGLLIDAARFRAAGLFDPGTFLYGEESIVALVADRQGWPQYVSRDIQVLHAVHGSSGGQMTARHAQWIHESLAYTFHRYHHLPRPLARALAGFASAQLALSSRLGAWLRRHRG